MKTNLFKDKVAIVTGAASGIGRAISNELGKLGALVIAADINFTGAKETASSIKALGLTAQAKQIDVTNFDDVRKLINEVVKEHGRLDYMFNNAGIAILGETRDMDISQWKHIIDVNLMGVIHGTTEAYAVMVKQKSGHIVNTASLAGLVPIPTETAYVVTKFGVVGLSTSLRAEAKDLGVKISVICPGFVKTEIMENLVALKTRQQDYIDKMPPMMDVKKAAKKILKGVKRNRSVILIGTDAYLLYLLQRLCPALLNPFYRRMMNILRSIRNDD